MDYLREYGRRLIDLGYPIIPIPRGDKTPGFSGWQQTVATPARLATWLRSPKFASAGVAILCHNFPAVDIDVLDAAMVETLKDVVREVTGVSSLVERIGRPPKALSLFRTDTPFTKMQTAWFESPDGQKHKVEILGSGQQFVAYAIHPGTGLPYEWTDPIDEPITTPPAELPLLTHAMATEIVRRCGEIMAAAGWVSTTKESSGGVVAPSDPLANAKPPLDLTLSQIAEMIDTQDADDHDNWVRVGMALWHQFNGSPEGFAIWDNWSSRSDKYDAQVCERRWPSFKPDLSKPPLTMATLVKEHGGVSRELAIEGFSAVTDAETGEPVEPKPRVKNDPETNLEFALARWIYVRNGDQVCDTTKPPNHALAPLKTFRNEQANRLYPVPAPTKQDEDRVKMVCVVDVWMREKTRRTAVGSLYAPGRPWQFRDSDRLLWVNEFRMAPHKQTDAVDRLDLFFSHMEYLTPDAGDREWFLDWMAFNLQHPERRSLLTPLHVSVLHGTGRGWVCEVMRGLLGYWNMSNTRMEVLVGDGSAGQYQDFFKNSLLCTIDEVRESGKRFSVNDKVRAYLTETRLEVNVKGKEKETKDIYTNFFFMSNHPDAMVLTEEDRRIYVLQGPHHLREEQYYQDLRDWSAAEDNLAQLFWWLMRRDLGRFKALNRPPLNEAKQAMIESNQSDVEGLFIEFLAVVNPKVATYRQITGWLCRRLQEEDPQNNFGDHLSEKQKFLLEKMLLHRAIHVKQIKFNGRGERPWVFDRANHKKLDLRAELEMTEKTIKEGVEN